MQEHILIFDRIQGFYKRRFQDMLFSLRRFDKSEVAQQRMKIIKFYERYGEKAKNVANVCNLYIFLNILNKILECDINHRQD